MAAIINAFGWHIWHLLTFRPVIASLPRSMNLAFGMVAASLPIVLIGQGPVMALFHAFILCLLLIKFQVSQVVLALCLISIPINLMALVAQVALPDMPWLADSLRFYETVLWVYTAFRWLNPPKE